MRRQPLQRRAQSRIADPVGRRLNRLRRTAGQIHGVSNRPVLDDRRAHAEFDPRQVGELFEQLQLPLQAFLLIAQARCPMAVSDHQRQLAFAPLGYPAMLAGGRLQLAFEQALLMLQTLGMAEDGFQRFGFT